MIFPKPLFLPCVIAAAFLPALTAFSSAAISHETLAGEPLISVLCDGDCSGLPGTPGLHDGSSFDFELGLRGVVGGFDLSLYSEGNVFLVGALRAAESIRLFGQTGIEVHGTPVISAEEVYFETGLLRVVSDPPRITLPRPGGSDYAPICACLSIESGLVVASGDGSTIRDSGLEISSGRDIRLRRVARSAANALVAVEGDVQRGLIPGLRFSRSGDLYVDLSRVTLNRLNVKAGQWVLIAGADALPIPEPATALLLGMGLIGLAGRRHRTAA